MKNSCAVITRFHYPLNSKEFDWRLDYYKNNVLPRLIAQTDKDFDIAIWCEKHHENIFKELYSRIKTFQATYTKRNSKLFIDYTAWENVSGLEKYNIQIGLDSDDLVEEDFIEKVKSLCGGDKTILVSFQPIKKDIANGKLYKMDKYSEKRGSPIFAFYQPNFNNYKFAYHTSHLRMPLIANKTMVVPEGYAQMSIHGRNDSTRIKETDKEI